MCDLFGCVLVNQLLEVMVESECYVFLGLFLGCGEVDGNDVVVG